MDKYTSLIRTKTFWVGFVGVLVNLLHFTGIDLRLDTAAVADNVVNVVNGILFLFAIYTRYAAEKQVVGVATVTPAKIAAAEAKK